MLRMCYALEAPWEISREIKPGAKIDRRGHFWRRSLPAGLIFSPREGYTAEMEPLISPGSLVQHLQRPGIWRAIGSDGELLIIEPWDDLAAGAFHPSEAYSLSVPSRLIRRLRRAQPRIAGRPGRPRRKRR